MQKARFIGRLKEASVACRKLTQRDIIHHSCPLSFKTPFVKPSTGLHLALPKPSSSLYHSLMSQKQVAKQKNTYSFPYIYAMLVTLIPIAFKAGPTSNFTLMTLLLIASSKYSRCFPPSTTLLFPTISSGSTPSW